MFQGVGGMKTSTRFCGFFVAIAVVGLVAVSVARADNMTVTTTSYFSINDYGAGNAGSEIEFTSTANSGPIVLILDNVAACSYTNSAGTPYTGWNAIYQAIKTGQASGWNTSSGGMTMANLNTQEYSLGYGEYQGNANEAIIMTTYLGDAQLLGTVTGNDYLAWKAEYTSQAGLTPMNYWTSGSFGYSGGATGNDYLAWKGNYTKGVPSLFSASEPVGAAGGLTGVPEPTSLVLLAVAAIALAAIKRLRS